METKRIDGKQIAAERQEQLKQVVAGLPRAPGLAVVLVGDHPASQVYVRHKVQSAERVGIRVDVVKLPADVTEEIVREQIAILNARADVDGIIVQLPLPVHMDERRVLECIDPEKDVDGLTSRNLGKMFVGLPALMPCTPMACRVLIQTVCPKPAGLHAVVVGRSCLVGKPMGQLLLADHCTVTQAHSRTTDLAAVCRKADILVVAAGKPNLITKDHVKPGAVIIDVGINRLPTGRLCGDVDFDAVQGIAGAITPVPGGVGPMTVTMLLENVVKVCVNKKA